MLAFMGLQINEVLVMGYLQQHNSIMIRLKGEQNTTQKKGEKSKKNRSHKIGQFKCLNPQPKLNHQMNVT
jgi:hypothetical protein